jgi:hypothetical protein
MSEPSDGVLQEYERLCNDFLQYKRDRLFVLGFTFTAAGAVIGIVAQERVPEQTSITTASLSLIVGLLSFSLLVVLAALVLTARYTEAIERLASYMRVFIEPEVRGLNWETRLRSYRTLKSGRRYRLLTRTDRSVAVYYFVLNAGLATLVVPTGAWRSPWSIPVWVLALTNCVLSIMLLRGIETRALDDRWIEVRSQSAGTRQPVGGDPYGTAGWAHAGPEPDPAAEPALHQRSHDEMASTPPTASDAMRRERHDRAAQGDG